MIRARQQYVRKQPISVETARTIALRLALLKRVKKSARSKSSLLKLINIYRLRQQQQPVVELSNENLQEPWKNVANNILVETFDDVYLALLAIDASFVEEIVEASSPQEAHALVQNAQEYINDHISVTSEEWDDLNATIAALHSNDDMLDITLIENAL